MNSAGQCRCIACNIIWRLSFSFMPIRWGTVACCMSVGRFRRFWILVKFMLSRGRNRGLGGWSCWAWTHLRLFVGGLAFCHFKISDRLYFQPLILNWVCLRLGDLCWDGLLSTVKLVVVEVSWDWRWKSVKGGWWPFLTLFLAVLVAYNIPILSTFSSKHGADRLCYCLQFDVIRCHPVVSNFNKSVRQVLHGLRSEKQRHLGLTRSNRKHVVGPDMAICGSAFFFLFQKGVTSHVE